MLNGHWLDAQNWAAKKQGGISEIGHYGLWHPTTHIVQIDGWRTATGEDYFSQGTSLADADFIRYYPQYIVSFLKPAEPKLVLKWGTIDAGQGIGTGSDMLRMLGEPLKNTDADMAALNRWIMERADLEPLAYPQYAYPYFWQFLFGDRSISAKYPQELNLSLTQHLEGIGIAIMRTGFDDIEDTVIVVGALPYMMDGHSGSYRPGFNIDKYGPLTFERGAYKRGMEHRQNTLRFTDPQANPDGGFAPVINGPNNIQKYTPNSIWYRGGITRIETLDTTGDYDYVYLDVTKNYMPERVNSYTRQFIYFRPQAKTDSDYVVIFDRTQTTRPDIIKRWEINMAYNPEINGQESQVREGKWEYTNNPNQIIITNDVDPDPYSGKTHSEAHGKLFVKTLLPQSVKMQKVGGPDHEFENDAGVAHGYENEAGDYNILNNVGALYTGTYFVDVIPTEDNSQENFLHVLQTADANFVSQMTPAVRVDGDTMVGAYIMDDLLGHKVTMFSKTEQNQTQATYTVPDTGQTIKHLIADFTPSFTYNIYQDGNPIGSQSVSQVSTLYFTSTGGGVFQITQGPPNLPPTITSLTTNPDSASGLAPLQVAFTATAQDTDGQVVSWSWDFGDGNTSTDQSSTIHIYQTPGTYTASLTVTDDGGTTSQPPATVEITVEETPTPPTITFQPQNQTVQPGQTATFQVTANGTVPLTYQWQKDQTDISGATNSSYTTPATTIDDNNTKYRCIVTNLQGQATSNEATLTVATPILTTIAITPITATIQPNAAQQFIAQGLDQFGNPMARQPNLVNHRRW